MKTQIKNLFLLPALIAGLGLMLAGRVTGQTFITTLHSFTALNNSTNSDGANSAGDLILSGDILYGTANNGGSAGNGTVFKVNTNGTGFTTLHSFTPLNNSTNSDGANPYARLILSGDTLYGTAQYGGSLSNGVVFKVNTDGTGFTNLHAFTGGSDGANPLGGLILSGDILYGTANNGGSSGRGTVFRISTNGTSFTNLHSFTFADGANPSAGLILSGSTLYGTAAFGGSASRGTVFRVNTNGTSFTSLYSFTTGTGFPPINSDGATPYAGLILSGDILYGTANNGGSAGNGTVFKVNTNGTGFTNLHSFTTNSAPYYTNSDGANPYARLILSGDTLYGTAYASGSFSAGTVFKVNADGTGFTNLHSFAGSDSGGGYPSAGLILSGNALYGTTSGYGNFGRGTVFSLSGLLPPTITNQPQNQYVIPDENATFSVGASGTLPLSYQWRFYGTNLADATDTSFTRSNVQSNDFGNYDAVVTNVAGSITSMIATLGYVLNPTLTNQHLGDGMFTFTLNGNTGRNYLIQQTTNMTGWSNVLTFSNILGPVVFTETNADVFFKVFRAKIVP